MQLDTNNIVDLFGFWADIMTENKDYLIDLDSVVGDADLGLTMQDGFKAAYAALSESEFDDIGKMLYTAGKVMANAAPSSMGTLLASGFMQAGKELKGMSELDGEGVAKMFQGIFDGIASRGTAKVGEKTFLDGLADAIIVLKQSAAEGITAASARAAADVAHEGFLSTKGMLARHGRAANRGEASRELLDPGAAVAELIVKGYADYIERVSA